MSMCSGNHSLPHSSRQILAKYINKYGENSQNNSVSKLSDQIQKYPRLYDLLELDDNYDL